MALLGNILNRAIFSHLLVAVPPAMILGQMVVDINEANLRVETQNLNLALATQMREALDAEVRLRIHLLGHAERILALPQMPLTQKQDMLRALVAEGTIDRLELFRKDGKQDSTIFAKQGPTFNAPDLSQDVMQRAQSHGFGLRLRSGGPASVTVVVPWTLDGVLFGYLGSDLPLAAFDRRAADLATQYLEGGGRIDVVDLKLRRVASSEPESRGSDAHSPFVGLNLGAGEGGLAQMQAGISTLYTDAQGASQLASVVSAPQLKWLVATSRPRHVAFASLRKTRFRVLLMSIAAALAAGVVALLLARQISRPVQALIRTTRKVAKADFRTPHPLRAYGELGQLARAFNHAIEHIEHYRRELRQTTQLRLRLSRLMSANSSKDALASTETQEDEPVERITILYADVRITRNHPGVKSEDLVALLGTFFAAAHESLARHGGKIDRYSGDAVIGIFQNHPEKALHAAKELIEDARSVSERWQETTPVTLEASVAVATGTGTLRRTVGTQDLSVTGDVVERAAQAQADAPSSEVVLDDNTKAMLARK